MLSPLTNLQLIRLPDLHAASLVLFLLSLDVRFLLFFLLVEQLLRFFFLWLLIFGLLILGLLILGVLMLGVVVRLLDALFLLKRPYSAKDADESFLNLLLEV